MAAIRTWNGAAWVAPHYCTDEAGIFGDEANFKTFDPSYFADYSTWDFTEGVDGWDIAAGESWAWWVAGEIRFRCLVYNSPEYIYSPRLGSPENIPNGTALDASLTVRAVTVPSSATLSVNWYVEDDPDTILDGAYNLKHAFTAAGERYTYTFPRMTKTLTGDTHFQVFPDWQNCPLNAEFAIEDGFIRRADGQPVGEDHVGWVPKFWNGSAWVAQTVT